jgi:cyanophycinase
LHPGAIRPVENFSAQLQALGPGLPRGVLAGFGSRWLDRILMISFDTSPQPICMSHIRNLFLIDSPKLDRGGIEGGSALAPIGGLHRRLFRAGPITGLSLGESHMMLSLLFRSAWTQAAHMGLAAALLLSTSLVGAACLSSEQEPNNTDTKANAGVCAGTTIRGTIGSGSDYDWYRLDVNAPGTLAISLAHASNVDFDWFLYAATGGYIAYASTSNNPETGAKAISLAGTYFLRVKRYSGTGSYSLTINGPLTGSGGGGASPPTFGSFSVPARQVGDAAFTITPPSSNSSGAFSYTSSNAAVATISGNELNVGSAGTSTITALQSADATHTGGSVSTTFTVTSGGTWPCTLPSGVDLGRAGSSSDVTRTTSGGSVLMGGGTDVDAAMQWMIGRSGGGDVLVLRSTGSNAYNSYLYGLGSVNSVQTLLVDSSSEGDNACVAETIRRAEMLFIAGGNQQDYVSYFKNRAVASAINYLINTKHAPIGGTSAGMAILGQYYHPGGAPDDASVLQNPTGVALGDSFLGVGLLSNSVTDTHFSQRTREPRLMAFMAATIYRYGVNWSQVRGIACDEATAYAVADNGAGKVFGSNFCFFARATGAPEVLSPGSALTWSVGQQALKVYVVPGTNSGSNGFDLGSYTGSGGIYEYWSANNGSFSIR